MLPEYGKWLSSLLSAKPELKAGTFLESFQFWRGTAALHGSARLAASEAPDELGSVVPILECSRGLVCALCGWACGI